MEVFYSYDYLISFLLMLIGFFGVINGGNLIKKIIGLSVFQVSILLFYVSTGYVSSAIPPILVDGKELYINPVPHVLMLTAIVVGVAVTAVGLALIIRIKEEYGTVEEDDIIKLDKIADKQEKIENDTI